MDGQYGGLGVTAPIQVEPVARKEAEWLGVSIKDTGISIDFCLQYS
jgi:hypothetical protein